MIQINVKQVCQVMSPANGASRIPKDESTQCKSSARCSLAWSAENARSLRKPSRPLLPLISGRNQASGPRPTARSTCWRGDSQSASET